MQQKWLSVTSNRTRRDCLMKKKTYKKSRATVPLSINYKSMVTPFCSNDDSLVRCKKKKMMSKVKFQKNIFASPPYSEASQIHFTACAHICFGIKTDIFDASLLRALVLFCVAYIGHQAPQRIFFYKIFIVHDTVSNNSFLWNKFCLSFLVYHDMK